MCFGIASKKSAYAVSSAAPRAINRAPVEARCMQGPSSRGMVATVAPVTVKRTSRFNWRPFTSAPRKRSFEVRASWGAPVEFSAAKVVSNKQAAEGLHVLLVDIGTLAAGYTKPGQYIQAKVGDSKPGFFAIASAPDANNQGVVELLIKSQPGSTAETLCGLPAGADISVSPVQGKGFPVDRLPADSTSTVLLFATGSGISPIKALLESGALGKRDEIRLYYGTRREATTAYQKEIPQWEAAGIKVVQVFSDAKTGYVQDVFAKSNGVKDGSRVGVVLCGQKDMCQAVTATAKELGVAPEKIIMNF